MERQEIGRKWIQKLLTKRWGENLKGKIAFFFGQVFLCMDRSASEEHELIPAPNLSKNTFFVFCCE